MNNSWVSWIWANIIEKLWPIVVVVIITQKFIEMRKPKLEMVPEGMKVGSWKTFDKNTGLVQVASPYHMWRIKIHQVRIPRYLAWLIRSREAALQCKAALTFYASDGAARFTMQGRWVNTPEISFISDQTERILYPDTISIGYNFHELLDCIIQFDGDKNIAYGWNNESYLWGGGRNRRHKLEKGRYKVDIRLSGQNFSEFTKRFDIVISEDWQGTSLTPAEYRD